MDSQSLEGLSVSALMAASEQSRSQLTEKSPVELFHSHLSQTTLLPHLSKHKRRRYYPQPCLRSNYSPPRPARTVTVHKPVKVHMMQVSIAEGAQGKTLPPTDHRLWDVKCKCLFLGGGGFKAVSSTVQCQSRACVNRTWAKCERVAEVYPQQESRIATPHLSAFRANAPIRSRLTKELFPSSHQRSYANFRTRTRDTLNRVEDVGRSLAAMRGLRS